MTRVRLLQRLLALALAVMGLSIAGAAWAYFTAVGAGAGGVTNGTLNPPTAVTVPASVSGGTVPVSWTAPVAGATPTGYNVTRVRTGDNATFDACGTPGTPVVTASCNDTGVSDGTYHYFVTALLGDSWTAVSASSNAVTVTNDATPPITASVTTPSSGSAYAPSSVPPAFSGSAADNAGGVGLNANTTTFTLQRSSDSFFWTGSGWQAGSVALPTTHGATTGNTAVTWTSASVMPTWASEPDGLYVVQATATDKNGSSFTGGANTFTLDGTAPTTASVSSPVNGAITKTFPATFSGTAADNANGAGLNSASTTYTLQRSTDSKYWTGSTWLAAPANLTTTHSATSGGTVSTWTSSSTMPNSGNLVDTVYTVQATATDKAGNLFSGSAVSFTLERVNPVTATVTSPASGTVTAAFPSSFAGSAADNAGGVGLNSGSTTYTLKRSTDNNFWTGSAWQASAVNLATTHSATTSNTAAAWASSATMPSAGALVDATYTVQATATDKAGNTLTGSAITFVLDRLNPTLASVTTPANLSQFRGASVPAPFSGQVADNSGGSGLNPNSTTFTIQRSTDSNYWNGATWQASPFALAATNVAQSSVPVTWTSSAVLPTWASEADATYTVQATATDKAGNSGAGTAVSFVLDNTSPSAATVTSPANGSLTNTFPSSFSGSAADNSGGVGLNANTTTYTLQRSTDSRFWNGSTWQVGSATLSTTHSATTANSAATWTSSATMPSGAYLVDATYTVQAKVTDKAGNTLTGVAITFTRDATAPITATVTSPTGGSVTTTFPSSFVGSAADNSGGVGLNADSTTYTLKRSTDNSFWTGSVWQVASASLATTHSATTSSAAATWTSAAAMPSGADLVDATYTVQATVTDRAGNVLTGTAISFTRDATPPTTASVSAPASGSVLRTATVPATITGSVADNAGGVGVNANTLTFTLQRPDNQYWTGSAWQVAQANLATTHSATTGNTATGWTDAVTLPAWASQADGVYTVKATATDKAGNVFTGPASTFTLDNALPTVTINQAVGQADPTSASPLNFTVTFSEPVTGFTSTDVSLAGTAGGTKTVTVTGGATVYNVAVSKMTASGTVIATIGANGAQDAAGNNNTASTSTDNTITWTLPTATAVTIANGSGLTAGKAEAGDVITVTFNRAIPLTEICSSWTSAAQSVSGVTVTMNRGNGSATNDLSFSLGSVGASSCGSVTFGTLGANTGAYETTNTTHDFENSTMSFNSATNQLVITLGACGATGCPPNTVTSSTYTFNPAGTVASGTPTTGNVKNY